jgi:hypothetical protein
MSVFSRGRGPRGPRDQYRYMFCFSFSIRIYGLVRWKSKTQLPISFCFALCNHLPSVSFALLNMSEYALAAAGIVLPPFFQDFYERMKSSLGVFRVKEGLLRKLKTALLSVNSVLEDAEDRQFMETSVKDWLYELKDTVYDAEDILDQIATEDLRGKLGSDVETSFKGQVRHYIPASPINVSDIEGKINDAIDRLEDLAKQISILGLRAGVGGKPLERLPTTSFVEESNICGRHCEKEAIINSLLSDDTSGSEIGVIAIVGMGGIGKTTLAQLVYNDNDRLKGHFDLKAWVCVSDPFDVFMVMKTILEEVDSPSNTDNKNLNQLQKKLKKSLTGRKFLLVLDDVWNTNSAKWEVLSNAFRSGEQESRVIVTTRNEEVARVMHASATHRIKELPEEDCWSLFAKYAFHDGHMDANPKLVAIGRQIVKKCKGLPLAIKAIGSLLWSKLDVDEWDKVLRSELWDLPIKETNILPALTLSYKYLSPDLKRCFAYCSLFPKDYAFKKDKLVLLWMAEGFLPQPKNKTMEEVGDDYFLALVSRSLFQRSNHDEYIMHDLVSDLAKFISKRFTLSAEDDCSCEIGRNTRHFSYSYNKFGIKKFEAFHKAERLRSIVELNFFVGNILLAGSASRFSLPMIKCLRVLILSHYGSITELPDSIGEFIHLRYLDLSWTWIKRLPDSICKLCNLQILNLSHCTYLAALPSDMHKLIHLCHLDFDETEIKEMPKHMGRLKCLQTLTKFIVGKDSESGIGELGKLTNLRGGSLTNLQGGSLSILNLQNVESPTDAKDVKLSDMKYLEKLVLEWKVDTNASESHRIVLDSLHPHPNLKSLAINDYGSQSFPDWIGHPSFSNIASLCLKNCKFCCSLPPLGELPSLQDLSIVGLDGVVIVGREFYGSESSSMKPFGALKVLRFKNMLKWEEWFSFDAEDEGAAFPKLENLEIYKCPKLTSRLPVHLPSLAKLEICECPELEDSLPRASPVFELELPLQLDYSSLEHLMLDGRVSLRSFQLDLFPKLCRLEIRDCGTLESLTVREQREHDPLLFLIDISIHWCPNFAYFPKGGLCAPNLKCFWIQNCRSLRSLPDNMRTCLPSLEKLSIEDCPQIESFPEGGLPSNLNEIYIDNCAKLFASRMGWGLQELISVKRFTIIGKYEGVESFPEVGLLPTFLTYLHIEGFPNLKSVVLQDLVALEDLMFWNCPKLKCMPEDRLPASLSTLEIYDCPLLREEWERKGEEWRKIAHVHCKYIDDRRIQ